MDRKDNNPLCKMAAKPKIRIMRANLSDVSGIQYCEVVAFGFNYSDSV